MTVTKIEVQKNNREKVNVYIDGKYSFSLTMNGFVGSGLKEWVDIDEEEIKNLKSFDSSSHAVLSAIDIVSHSMKTEKELRKRLKDKGFLDEAAGYAIDKMKEYGYVDDDFYVSSYITSKAIPNGWGEQKITYELIKKGIEKDKIREKLEELYPDDIKINIAVEAAEKYAVRLKGMEPKKARQKIYQHLIAKGFSFDEAKEACIKTMEGDCWE